MNYILTYLGNTHINNNEKELSTFGNFFSGLKQGLNQILPKQRKLQGLLSL